jgi:hypothetical protein
MKRRGIYFTLLISCILVFSFCNNSFSQQISKTTIKGSVTDSKTGDPIPFVAILLENTTVGTITNDNGYYIITTNAPAYKIRFSYLGYDTQTHIITPGKTQTINIKLVESSVNLNEVVVKPKKVKYRNKDNEAVDLIKNVINNKALNRKEGADYLMYDRYEKIKFGLINFDERFSRMKPFKDVQFIFDNVDSTTYKSGKINLPLYMKETYSAHYYRKEPEADKEIIKAEKTINFNEYLDDSGVSSTLKYMYQDINIYDNEIFFLTNKFLSPVAGSAPVFYKYFIIDTSLVDDTKCIKLFFEPRNPEDFLFHGFLYITDDTIYAIKKIDMSFNKGINIDWVKDVRIVQDFQKVGERSWMLSVDDVLIDFELTRDSPGMFGQRTVSYTGYAINEPIDESIFKGPDILTNKDVADQNAMYWEAIRTPPLTENEQRIYSAVDSVKKVPSFKRKMDIIMLLTTEFLNLGKFEIGPVSSFYSYNPIEGSRIKFGGRTTSEFNKWIYFEPFVAYGFGDKQLKYNFTTTLSLTGTSIYQFPVKSLKISYGYNTTIPGQELQYTTGDNVFLSFKRGLDDKMYYNRTLRVEHLNEFQNHFSYTLGYNFTRQTPGGNLDFNIDLLNKVPYLDISEAYLKLRYAPREEFYQGKIYRDVVPSKNPVYTFQYTIGSNIIGNDFNYQKLYGSVTKRFYLSIVGYTDVRVEAGKIFGTVPYPLMFIHNANQTYAYQRYSYNMMNFLEFVSDEYVALNIDHSFNGFFVNKVPLLKKMKLREVVTLKALYGGVSDRNQPDLHTGLYMFPRDSNGEPLTYTLEKKPYIEASVGFSNILRVFRVDLIKRFTYLNQPNVSSLGVRVQFRFDI